MARWVPACLWRVVLGCGVLVLGTGPVRATDWAGVEPIFRASCVECHGPQKTKGNFRADSRDEVVKGRGDRPWILPGDSAGSPLMRLLSGQTTTRKAAEKHRLPEKEMEQLRGWIAAGAK